MLGLMASMYVVTFVYRMWAVKFRGVQLAHYELFNLSQQPTFVTRATNNLNNLFQLPPIFIGACILAIALNYNSQSLIFNAWGFVAARLIHTLVHITINRVLIRSSIFTLGFYFLVSIWVELLAHI